MERTLYTLAWLEGPLRRRATASLNKGEVRTSLAHAIFFYRPGEIRDAPLKTSVIGPVD